MVLALTSSAVAEAGGSGVGRVRGVSDSMSELQVAYGDLTLLVRSISEHDAWLPTGCTGWSVRDLILHLLSDAQRGLVALYTPTEDPPDRDAVSYWVDAPSGDDAEYREVRAVRTIASTYGLRALTRQYTETSMAVLALAERTDPHSVFLTQEKALRVDDLLATLAVEAAVHHLDLVANLDASGPAAGPLALVRRTLDGLLGHPVQVDWDDVTYAQAATGRRALTVEEATLLGHDASRLPLLS